MKKDTCKHCGEEIGLWWEEYGPKHSYWMHAPDDGPDAWPMCDCHCAECDPVGGYTDGRECCDGCEAEPSGSFDSVTGE